MLWFPLKIPAWIRWPSPSTARHVLYGIILGFSLALTSSSLALYFQARKRQHLVARFEPRPIESRSDDVLSGVTGLIGNTPLFRINSLSDALGVEILGKAEFLNPGGSVKDRVALRMIDDAERLGQLRPHTGSRIFEGTSGSTGISIALIARARGYDATIIMPDDVAEEKVKAVKALGADVERVRPASIVDKKQYVNHARQRATQFGRPDTIDKSDTSSKSSRPHMVSSSSASVVVTTTASRVSFDVNDPQDNDEFMTKPRGYFADQFENRSNYEAHLNGTGPEIWRQTNGRVHAFVSGAGYVCYSSSWTFFICPF